MEAPQYYNMGGYFGAGVPATFNDYSPEKNQKLAGDPSHFIVDDLLDFPNDDDAIMTDGFFDNIAKNCAASTADSPAFTSNGDSCNSSSTSAGGPNPAAYQSFADSHFSSELCVPYDDLAELEWLSNFVDDSFSADQTYQPNHLQMLTGSKSHTTESSSSDAGHLGRNMNHAMFQPDTPLPGKARSKRSRANPANWTTRLLQLAAPSGKAASKKQPQQQQEEDPTKLNSSGPGSGPGSVATMRRCLHCGSEKTPQWRTGPMGPKTLCNACGVRYKSGRLVPEYRPAASPTFVPAKHSNSHRKVLELRRQRELHATQQEQYLNQSSFFGVSNGGHELMVHHHHGGPSFRHMI